MFDGGIDREVSGAVAPFSLSCNEQVKTERLKYCPSSKLNVEIVDEFDESHKTVPARCKKWSCPFCSGINARNLARLAVEVLGMWFKERRINGAAVLYRMKLVTLTCPGSGWRSMYSVGDALRLGTKAFRKLLGILRRRYGDLEYWWVLESQESGYPHWHLLILGDGIAGKEVMRFINDKWDELGMGRSEVRQVKKMDGCCFYLSKYLSKGGPVLDSVYAHYHRWGMSQRLRRRVKEERELASVRYTVIRVFHRNPDGTNGKKIYDATEGQEFNDLENGLLQKGLAECLEFFGKKADGVRDQVFLWDGWEP